MKNHDPMQSKDIETREEDSNHQKKKTNLSQIVGDSSEYGLWILVGDWRRRSVPTTSKSRGPNPHNGNLQID